MGGEIAAAERIVGSSDVLLLCDHASNAVPGDIDLGVGCDVLSHHVAVDIGAAPLTRALARSLDAPAVLGTVSRLVIDLNRARHQTGLVPTVSDGVVIPGNSDADVDARIERFHEPYHRVVRAEVVRHRPRLIVAVHSFTRQLGHGGSPARPWEVGILHNPRLGGAAGPALAFLRDEGLTVGDNEPYSGERYNATLDRHALGIAAINVEVRNDLIADDAGVSRWSDILSRMIGHVRNSLAQTAPLAT
ncbi:MAG: N-formylglutamate amidohydrolase [Pseudomonadota bacterium]